MTQTSEAKDDGDHWVFGYGSLMWRPGFAFIERRRALHQGRRRAFCIYSVHHRGTPTRPGLVLGLAQGGAVRGIAYRVAPEQWGQTYAYLKEREQPTETYIERHIGARLDDGRRVRPLSFLSDRRHPQWAGSLSPEAQADLIAGARGLSGRNVDYLAELVRHLEEEGLSDPALENLLTLVLAREPHENLP